MQCGFGRKLLGRIHHSIFCQKFPALLAEIFWHKCAEQFWQDSTFHFLPKILKIFGTFVQYFKAIHRKYRFEKYLGPEEFWIYIVKIHLDLIIRTRAIGKFWLISKGIPMDFKTSPFNKILKGKFQKIHGKIFQGSHPWENFPNFMGVFSMGIFLPNFKGIFFTWEDHEGSHFQGKFFHLTQRK